MGPSDGLGPGHISQRQVVRDRGQDQHQAAEAPWEATRQAGTANEINVLKDYDT